MAAPSCKRRAVLRMAALLLILGIGTFLSFRHDLFGIDHGPDLARTVRELGELRGAAPLFILLYAVAATVGLPGTILTLAGGAIFGVVVGSLLNWIGATAGATGAYVFGRWLGRDSLRELLGDRAGKVNTLAADHGFWTILRLRLIPLVPFNALNLGAGAAGVRLRDYVLATALGILPGTVVYTYFADVLLEGASGAFSEVGTKVLIAGLLLVLLSFVPTIARRFGWVPAADRA